VSAERIGTWRILARAWPLTTAAVLGNAALQALLVVGRPATALDVGFVLRTVASAVAIILLGAILANAADAAVDARRVRMGRPPVLAWSTIVVVLAAGSWVLTPFAAPFVIVAGLVLRPVGEPPRPAVRALRPFPAVLAALLTIVLALLSWVAGLVCGFFVTGPLGTFLAWTFAGIALAVTVAVWRALHRPAS
jgi:hypothetical protein